MKHRRLAVAGWKGPYRSCPHERRVTAKPHPGRTRVLTRRPLRQHDLDPEELHPRLVLLRHRLPFASPFQRRLAHATRYEQAEIAQRLRLGRRPRPTGFVARGDARPPGRLGRRPRNCAIIQYPVLNIQYTMLAGANWILDNGCWLLDNGYWLRPCLPVRA